MFSGRRGSSLIFAELKNKLIYHIFFYLVKNEETYGVCWTQLCIYGYLFKEDLWQSNGKSDKIEKEQYYEENIYLKTSSRHCLYIYIYIYIK